MSRYPSFRHVLLLSLLALPLCRYLVYPVTAALSERLGLVATELVLLWILSLSARRTRWSAADVLLLNATPPRVLAVAAGTAVGAALVVAQFDLAWAELLRRAGMIAPASLQRYLLEVQLVRDLPGLAAALAAVAVAPALCEEAYFRGFAFTSLASRRGAATAVVGSAALFAAVHLNPWQLPALFLFGVFLGLLVCWTHSLYPAIVAHLVNNLLSVAGVNLRAHTGADLLGASEPLPGPLLAAAMAVLLLGSAYLRRQSPLLPLVVGESPVAAVGEAEGPSVC
ncbi:MAG: CPBP family intramembrane glutamic endopeptidase [Gemmatimonadota bacterium]